MNTYSFISGLFSEKKCYNCFQVGHFFCIKCRESLDIYTPYCYFCKKDSDHFMTHTACLKHFSLRQVIVLTHYRQNGIKKLLKHAKYYGKYQSYKDIVEVGETVFRENVIDKNAVFVPIPIPLFRRWKRGYNQTEIIAQYLRKILDVPINKHILRRRVRAKQQSHLSQSQRLKNLSGNFILRKNKLPPDTTIYLIDDIVSTGATLMEASRVLKAGGFMDIRAIVLASD